MNSNEWGFARAIRPRRGFTVMLLLGGSTLFGVLFAVLKGTGGGWHMVLGNLSAPWLVLPIAAGAVASRRSVTSGLVGGLAALLSLAAFYATTATLWHMVKL
ncbi:hypothetical protein [Leekyejoonella antrihumi]|uniref:Uncharacterized protein n=1 Tax=Leekyejoonella antrihumi TaxID=1660198 RepID=A0A563DSJ0_9MICO|nr:hypothetical protein [Leekyejoonella antrihumi]TWP33210.1 hypothetical protein FGL98_22030 [Leekyejoonella antrihumi]